MITKKIVALFAALTMAVSLGACSVTADAASDPAYVTLRYEGGDVGGSKFKEIVAPGEKLASNDAFYAYPTTQRQDKWDTANFKQGAESADYKDMILTAQGGVGVAAKVTVPFMFNSDTSPVEVNGKTYEGGAPQVFHELIGKTRKAYFNPEVDGNDSYGKGWLWVMDTYISTCTNQVLIPKVRPENPENLWLKDEVRQNINSTLRSEIQVCVNAAMETDIQFFEIGAAAVNTFTPDSEFVSLYRERQDAETKAETADLNRDAKVKEAEANAAVAAAEAKVKQAEIQGLGGNEAYQRLKAIEKGLNPFQPTFVVSGSVPAK